MESLPRCKSRKLYSWWWDSHVRPNNTNWLHQSLADMDSKVKSMIKIIEQDGDTFATRAESYFQKRPELMSLVEEFYKAYRALAERYDCANVELRQAHRSAAQDSAVVSDDDAMPELRRFESLSSPEGALIGKVIEEIESKKEELAARFHEDLQSLFSFELELNEDGCLGRKESRTEVELSVMRETLQKLEATEGDEMIAILQDAISVSDHRVDERAKKDNEMESRRAEMDVLMEIIAQKDRELMLKKDNVKVVQMNDEGEVIRLLTENEKLERDLGFQVSQNSVLEQKLCAMNRKYRDEKWTLRTVCEEKNELYERLQSLEKEINDTVQESREKVMGLLRENSELLSEMKKTREKMRHVEDVHLVLKEEKKCLVNERNALLDEMQGVGMRMGSLEARFSKVEEKCTAFEISLLHKFIQELEIKNKSLALECKKHQESLNTTCKIMAQFEAENLDQLAEIQFLMDEIEFLEVKSIEEKLLLEIENMVLVTFVHQIQTSDVSRIEGFHLEESLDDVEHTLVATRQIQASEKAAADAQYLPGKEKFDSGYIVLGGRSSHIWKDNHILDETEWQSRAELKLRDIQLDLVSEYSSSRYNLMFEDWAHEIAQVSRRNSTAYQRTRSRKNHSRRSMHRKNNSIIEFQIEKEYPDKLILQRLESDATTLISAELVVQELAAKLEAKRGKNAKGNEIEMFKKQLADLEDQILQLFGSTNQLARDIQSSSSPERSLLAERAVKGSEMIGCLRYEVESMQYNVSRLIQGKKREGKAKTPGRGILLKQFINNGDTNRKKRNKFLCVFQNKPL